MNKKHKKEMMLDEVLGETCKSDENKMEWSFTFLEVSLLF